MSKLFSINTFSFIIKSKYIKIIKSVEKLKKIILKYNISKYNSIILGDCSNTIFLENFNGFILLNRIFGIKKYNYKKKWILHVNSGEKWYKLVKFSLKNNIYGLENLYNIPGRVGSAPVNNIGAYGVELKNFCKYVYVININNLKIYKLNNKECNFKYRDSIFKNNNYIIISIVLELYKKWKPILYKNIFNNININILVPNLISNIIYKNRKKNIPDYNIIGNSGSFFKNFLVSYNYIKKYNNIPYIKYNNNLCKISTNWIINNSFNKNLKIGNISMFNRNKIILVNYNKFEPRNLIIIIRIIKKIIKNKFSLKLINEVFLIKNNLINKNKWLK
ncbi:UDP-N-acetylmuramate dehydrogenase [Candidatus Nardonella dryophthoridicola]|uniref:UDP-N-acetylenolpyruvoylglucosamine reductase n=1 Tax=endosymbiont of Rhynchophorus ferrugineus TaxID=1972133 RepID=A0A2Z5T9C2_9GAMM|nr:UDP-N-acetylmuramate dehydrogenase [Candidatus Nardonella dryophthoridicola]QTJ62890.1 UDP-N-acetylmuramate dehydrogenase [Candidatus Nardonella dryophthoridicola]BBA85136.1 UDP-N-acetylenolpyruvoylglucosamine reductase [endosymbiont of Rhynchophorus ferrugineus]